MLTVTYTTEGSCQATSQASRTMSLPRGKRGTQCVVTRQLDRVGYGSPDVENHA